MSSVAVRYVEAKAGSASRSLLDDLYSDRLDVAVIRGAFSEGTVADMCRRLESDDRAAGWARPNQVLPGEDIHLLGTDVPATPTCKAPRGASLDDYLSGGAGGFVLDAVFADFELRSRLESLIGEVSGGLPAAVPVAPDGRSYIPYTVRRLPDGQQISIHHDYHYPLALYSDLKSRVDTATLVSFVLQLQSPEAGGELMIYSLRSDDPAQPYLPNGMWDKDAIEERYAREVVKLNPGDFFLLASGRCFHRVQRVQGPNARITLGGFLAFDRDHTTVYCWS